MSNPHQQSDYEVPVVHIRIPKRVGDAGFWIGLAGAVATSAVELPVAGLLAIAVVAKRRRADAGAAG